MFGYIKPLEDELRVRELKAYRAVYCGLCNTSKKRISRFSRFFLSFDYTFFALVHMLFTDEPVKTEKVRCGFHLFAKKDVVAENSSLALSCAIFSLLTYYKLLDTVKDEKLFRSLGARFFLPTASHMRKKAIKGGFAEADFIISDCLEAIAVLETKPDTVCDDIADVFGEMMGHLMKTGLSEEIKDKAFTVGCEVGKFIYFADAADDLYSDEKKGRFNPFLAEYGNAENAKDELTKSINLILRGTDAAADIISEFKDELPKDKKTLCSIARNVLYLGCPAVIQGILKKNDKHHPKG